MTADPTVLSVERVPAADILFVQLDTPVDRDTPLVKRVADLLSITLSAIGSHGRRLICYVPQGISDEVLAEVSRLIPEPAAPSSRFRATAASLLLGPMLQFRGEWVTAQVHAAAILVLDQDATATDARAFQGHFIGTDNRTIVLRFNAPHDDHAAALAELQGLAGSLGIDLSGCSPIGEVRELPATVRNRPDDADRLARVQASLGGGIVSLIANLASPQRIPVDAILWGAGLDVYRRRP